jgi:hypothetical protein
VWSDLGRLAAGCAVFASVISVAGVRAAENVATNIDLMQQLTASVVTELHGKFNGTVSGRTVRLKPAGATEDYAFVTNVFLQELTRLGVSTLEPAEPLKVSSYTQSTGAGATTDAANAARTTTNPALQKQLNEQFATQPTPDEAASPTDSLAPSEPVPSFAPPTQISPGGAPALTLQFQNVVFDLQYLDSHRSFMIGGKRVDRRASVRIRTTLTDETGRVLWVGEAERSHEDEVDYGDAARLEQGTYQFNRPVVPESGWGKIVEPVFVTGIIVGLIYLFFSNQSDN